jgi:hypothetical protein
MSIEKLNDGEEQKENATSKLTSPSFYRVNFANLILKNPPYLPLYLFTDQNFNSQDKVSDFELFHF